jgi:hypothetical protein
MICEPPITLRHGGDVRLAASIEIAFLATRH